MTEANSPLPSEGSLAELKARAIEVAPAGIVCIGAKPVLALVGCVEALKELSAMYAHTWDRADGALVMMDSGVVRFEEAHSKASQAIANLEAVCQSK